MMLSVALCDKAKAVNNPPMESVDEEHKEMEDDVPCPYKSWFKHIRITKKGSYTVKHFRSLKKKGKKKSKLGKTRKHLKKGSSARPCKKRRLSPQYCKEHHSSAHSPKGGHSPAHSPKGGHSPAHSPKGGHSRAHSLKAGHSSGHFPKAGHSSARYPKAGHSSARYPKAGHSSARYPKAGHSSAHFPKAGHSSAHSPKAGHSSAHSPKAGHSSAHSPKGGDSSAHSPKGGDSPAHSPKGGDSPAHSPKGGDSPAHSPIGGHSPGHSPKGGHSPGHSSKGSHSPAHSPKAGPSRALSPQAGPSRALSPLEGPSRALSPQEGHSSAHSHRENKRQKISSSDSIETLLQKDQERNRYLFPYDLDEMWLVFCEKCDNFCFPHALRTHEEIRHVRPQDTAAIQYQFYQKKPIPVPESKPLKKKYVRKGRKNAVSTEKPEPMKTDDLKNNDSEVHCSEANDVEADDAEDFVVADEKSNVSKRAKPKRRRRRITYGTKRRRPKKAPVVCEKTEEACLQNVTESIREESSDIEDSSQTKPGRSVDESDDIEDSSQTKLEGSIIEYEDGGEIGLETMPENCVEEKYESGMENTWKLLTGASVEEYEDEMESPLQAVPGSSIDMDFKDEMESTLEAMPGNSIEGEFDDEMQSVLEAMPGTSVEEEYETEMESPLAASPGSTISAGEFEEGMESTLQPMPGSSVEAVYEAEMESSLEAFPSSSLSEEYQAEMGSSLEALPSSSLSVEFETEMESSLETLPSSSLSEYGTEMQSTLEVLQGSSLSEILDTCIVTYLPTLPENFTGGIFENNWQTNMQPVPSNSLGEIFEVGAETNLQPISANSIGEIFPNPMDTSMQFMPSNSLEGIVENNYGTIESIASNTLGAIFEDELDSGSQSIAEIGNFENGMGTSTQSMPASSLRAVENDVEITWKIEPANSIRVVHENGMETNWPIMSTDSVRMVVVNGETSWQIIPANSVKVILESGVEATWQFVAANSVKEVDNSLERNCQLKRAVNSYLKAARNCLIKYPVDVKTLLSQVFHSVSFQFDVSTPFGNSLRANLAINQSLKSMKMFPVSRLIRNSIAYKARIFFDVAIQNICRKMKASHFKKAEKYISRCIDDGVFENSSIGYSLLSTLRRLYLKICAGSPGFQKAIEHLNKDNEVFGKLRIRMPAKRFYGYHIHKGTTSKLRLGKKKIHHFTEVKALSECMDGSELNRKGPRLREKIRSGWNKKLRAEMKQKSRRIGIQLEREAARKADRFINNVQNVSFASINLDNVVNRVNAVFESQAKRQKEAFPLSNYKRVCDWSFTRASQTTSYKKSCWDSIFLG
ncbi:uncharacterized protein LOC129959554 isoform X13 [Argiope bruennichi]|uniref:uncharacterized protein LOC129959554 isoform X13 n=1 Tax=Argiope bruennichi TaxID=94029 RepID=UPI002494D400|nr:uncharacterized protein LOC129959554 isoform X13 [Argiope bruennichi]